MTYIRPIQQHEIPEAKLLIFTIAHELFKEAGSLEESIALYTAKGKLGEMDNVQKHYFENGGTFLVTVSDDKIIGTGAIRYLQEGVCELKRLWFRFEYQGQGYGYQMMQELIRVAREKGYKTMRLLTDRDVQKKAVSFYEQLGFHEIPSFGDDPDDMGMEMGL